MVFCLRCSEHIGRDEEMAFALRLTMQDVLETKRLFLKNGFIDDSWNPINWAKRQHVACESAPDDSRRRGYVYYVADSSRIKIGFSSNPWARFSELRVANPGILMLGTEPGDRSLERQRHQEFKDMRITGEWFYRKSPLTDFVASLRSRDEVATTKEQNRTEQKKTIAQLDVERIYQAYPRHIGKEDAKKAIVKVLRSGAYSVEWLLERVSGYAEKCKGEDVKFIPYPATWFNKGHYDDEDLQPKEKILWEEVKDEVVN